MNTDTLPIIVTTLGAGIALFTLLSRRIDASVNSRSGALYQALFSHKDPAA